jgi:predicted 2-oxoglutarate/Fe(II)-dependent dioxygenase YbiX
MNTFLEENNYLYIPQFIDSGDAILLSEEFKQFARTNNLKSDTQVEGSPACYDYIAFLELLCEKTPQVSKFLGERVLPTYSYARVYQKGAVLEPHTDREACEISLTVQLNGDAKWPIFIKKPNGESISLNLKSGDAMLYLGTVGQHWRERYEGNEHVQIFLHYVRSRGKNNFAYFDKERIKPTDTPINLISPTVISEKEEIKKISDEVKNNTYPVNIEDYIIEVENVVPEWLIDAIFREYENCNNWEYAGTAGGVDRNIRNVDEVALSSPIVLTQNKEIREYLDKELYECAKVAIQNYNNLFPHSAIKNDSGYQLLRYFAGQFYKEHCDNFTELPRTVSCSFALNDDYEGGEWAFFNSRIKKKPKRGSALLFPSNFMYPHQILPITKGVRYSVITWFN